MCLCLWGVVDMYILWCLNLRTHETSSASLVVTRQRRRPYCQTLNLTAQLDRADQEKDSKKTKALSQKMDQVQKQLGPEFVALVRGLDSIDLNSPDGREILSIIGTLNQSCEH
jgi:hypothetical protein